MTSSHPAEPEQVGPVYVGNVDLVSDREVTGWVWKPGAPEERVEVALIFVDGRKLTSLADIFRPDVGAAGIGDGKYGFHFPVGAADRENLLTVEVVDGSFPLRNLLTHPAPAAVGAPPGAPMRARPIGKARTRTVTNEAAGKVTGVKVTGVIEQIQGSFITGWMAGSGDGAIPILTVNRVPLEPLDWLIDRPDVREATGMNAAFGFRFRATGFGPRAQFRLYAQIDEQRVLVVETEAGISHLERNTLRQLYRALAIARQPGSAAITCWDGAHNPIGRAKVLYDILATERPVALFSYIMGDFGDDIWPPLSGSDAVIVTIPWAERDRYHRVIAAMDIRFDLVWLCKARLPTFTLAAAVARPDAALILDFDDNEDHFARSLNSQQKAYGASMIGLCRMMTDLIPARTAASATLQERYGASLVRHARTSGAVPHKRSGKGLIGQGLSRSLGRSLGQSLGLSRPKEPANVGFIGTVRPHKRILEAANAIGLLAGKSGQNIRFHVYGDISPPKLRADLIEAGVIVKDMVPAEDLRTELAVMDVILTGFPSADGSDSPVTEYQISSKIGDALAMGRPVLTPRVPSARDLDGVPGIFLFDETDFAAQMGRALQLRKKIELPAAFTLEGARDGFASAERQALAAPRARDVFALTTFAPVAEDAASPALLLMWKQNDGGLYGRRVDQIARAYKRAHPGHRVIVVEFQNDRRFANQTEAASQIMSDAHHIVRLSHRKVAAGHIDEDGVAYHEIRWQEIVDRNHRFDQFLIDHALYPDRTVVVLFPIMNDIGTLHASLANYAKISDVVDNHISWETGRSRSEAFAAYSTQTMGCAHVVFNSAVNEAFFRDLGVIGPDTAASVIPNWYLLPQGTAPLSAAGRQDGATGRFNILYSGNMNNRIDWSLMETIAGLSDRVRLHLVGAAQRAGPGFEQLLAHPQVIYHGALPETATLEVMRMMDLAVMPHLTDGVSTYMNPLKLHMYQAMGLQSVALDVPGIAAAPLLTICPDADSFRAAVETALAAHARPAEVAAEVVREEDAGRSYTALIDALRRV